MHYSRSTRGGMKASISSSRKSSATRRGASGCTAAIVNVVVMYVFPPHAAPLAPKLSLMSLGLRWKYYDAVEQLGPLPPRLKAPMWRSPESSPSKKPVCISFSDGGHDESENIAIKQQHKNAISRHRDQWERAKTPPRFWNIGFPDTQEVAAINAEAARRHESKRAVVTQEAE